MTNFASLIKDKALSLGFSACGMAKAEPLEEEIISRYQGWLKKGYHYPMSYMENHQEKRFNPLLLEPGTTSIISVLLSYASHQDLPTSYKIARYAWGKDYHLVVKEKLKSLADFIHASYPSAHLRIFTDSAPVMERSWAVKAGLGWIGKNGLLLTKTWGSYVVIGEIFCDIPLTYDTPLTDASCGSCTRCIDACPTQAIVSPSVINAQRCISALTIEEKRELPLWLSTYIGKRIYGCDTCQEVCPWNTHCTLSTTPEFRPCVDMQQMNDQDWAQLTPERFSSLFKESAIKRITYPRFKRNIDFIPHAE